MNWPPRPGSASSSLARPIAANRPSAAGSLTNSTRAASLLDTDLGQNGLGPPACITLGQVHAGALATKHLYFVGGVDPAPRIGAIVAGAARLAALGEGRLIINTCGMVN